MPNASPRKIAKLWAILKPLATAAKVSNAPLVTNGLVFNPIRNVNNNSVINTASNILVLGPAMLEEAENFATINMLSALVQVATIGKMEVANKKHQITLIAQSEHYSIVTTLVLIV